MNVKDKQRIDFFIFMTSFIITSLGLVIRNLLHYNNIIRFIGNSFGNIGGVIVVSYLFFWLVKESNFKKREIIIFSVGLGLVIYEFSQIFIPWQTFDKNDIWGTFIGVILSSIINILCLIPKTFKKQSND